MLRQLSPTGPRHGPRQCPTAPTVPTVPTATTGVNRQSRGMPLCHKSSTVSVSMLDACVLSRAPLSSCQAPSRQPDSPTVPDSSRQCLIVPDSLTVPDSARKYRYMKPLGSIETFEVERALAQLRRFVEPSRSRAPCVLRPHAELLTLPRRIAAQNVSTESSLPLVPSV